MERKHDLERMDSSDEGTEMEKRPAISAERVDSFLAFLQSQGRAKKTIGIYRRCMERLLAFLPDSNKEISADVLLQWTKAMREEGVALRTINRQISIVNSYLDFSGRRELRLKPIPCPHKATTEPPTLTWPEYLRLLQTAQTLDDRRAGMLVRLFCDTGIRLCEIANVTLEAVNAGEIVIEYKSRPKRVLLPSGLRTELRDYAHSAGIVSGALFVRKNGTPLDHSEILPLIVKLFKKAGVLRNKATTKILRQFYHATYEKISSEIAAQMEIAFEVPLKARGAVVT